MDREGGFFAGVVLALLRGYMGMLLVRCNPNGWYKISSIGLVFLLV